MPDKPLVYIVDDDEAVRHGLRLLLESVGHAVEDFGNAESFLAGYDAERPACLILDVRLPSTSGLELQDALAERGRHPPIIFLTGHGNVPVAVRALKGGAFDFFQKPVADEQMLLDRVEEAIRQDRAAHDGARASRRVRALVETLTPREKEVMDLICAGKANKVIAADLGISERTVELHRSHVMKKMKVRTVPDLIRLQQLAADDE